MDVNEIRRAQMIAGENAVIENLKRKGLIKNENEDMSSNNSTELSTKQEATPFTKRVLPAVKSGRAWNGAHRDADLIEILILKYENTKRQQEKLQKETPLSNAVQHQLLDQNIHIFNGVIEDLRMLL